MKDCVFVYLAGFEIRAGNRGMTGTHLTLTGKILRHASYTDRQ